jgi:hypothetical protein
MVSPPDFLNGNSDTTQDIGGPVHHLVIFLSFTALKKELIWLYDIFLSQ